MKRHFLPIITVFLSVNILAQQNTKKTERYYKQAFELLNQVEYSDDVHNYWEVANDNTVAINISYQAVFYLQKVDEKPKQAVLPEVLSCRQGQYLLYKAIFRNSAMEVKKVYKGIEKFLLSNPNFPKDKLREQMNQPHCKGKTPIEWAVSLGRSNAVEALLECGAAPDHLSQALLLGDAKSALALVKNGAYCFGGMNKDGFEPRKDLVNYPTAMGYAIALYDYEPEIALDLIQAIFDRGYNQVKYTWNTNQTKTNVWALALLATTIGICEVETLDASLADLFVKNGADVNQHISHGNGSSYDTPLGLATHRGDVNAVLLLLDRGADPNKEFCHGKQRYTPLKVAGRASQPNAKEIITLLRKYGARD